MRYLFQVLKWIRPKPSDSPCTPILIAVEGDQRDFGWVFDFNLRNGITMRGQDEILECSSVSSKKLDPLSDEADFK